MNQLVLVMDHLFQVIPIEPVTFQLITGPQAYTQTNTNNHILTLTFTPTGNCTGECPINLTACAQRPSPSPNTYTL